MTIPHVKAELDRDGFAMPSAETIGHMGRLVGMYLEELNKLREKTDPEVG